MPTFTGSWPITTSGLCPKSTPTAPPNRRGGRWRQQPSTLPQNVNNVGGDGAPGLPHHLTTFGLDHQPHFPSIWVCWRRLERFVATRPIEGLRRIGAGEWSKRQQILPSCPTSLPPGDTRPGAITAQGSTRIHTFVPVNSSRWGWSATQMPNFAERTPSRRATWRRRRPVVTGYPYGTFIEHLYPVDVGLDMTGRL